MSSNNKHIDQKIRAYKKKYFTKKLLSGTAIFLAVILVVFLIFSFTEHLFRLNQSLRAGLFFSFVGMGLVLLYQLIVRHLIELIHLDNNLSDEVAAKQIGQSYPDIGDRLLNMVQLRRNATGSLLAEASVRQRANFFSSYEFSRAINFRDTFRYWQVALGIVIFLAMIYYLKPEIIRSSPERIINFNKEFVPEAPFRFISAGEELIAFRNEDFVIEVGLEGEALPAQVYLESNSRKIKMQKADDQSFTYSFSKIQDDITFNFEAAGFRSQNYKVNVVSRPQLGDFNIIFNYPSYLNRNPERLENTGHLQVPEGTMVEWQMQPKNADKVALIFHDTPDTIASEEQSDNLISFNKKLMESSDYEVLLQNKYSRNINPIVYHAEVIPDRFPEINVTIFQDTMLYQFIMMSGNLNDDYGLTNLYLNYRIKSEEQENDFRSIRINLPNRQSSQSFSYEWLLDSLNLMQGQELQYFLQVWDNDGVNGIKSSKTGIYTFRIPDRQALKEEIEKATEKTQESIDETLNEAREINRQIEEAAQRLKGKKDLNWQEEKQLRELIEKREELNKALEELRKQHQNQELKRERFNPKNEKLKEQAKQLQKLMDELLDEETKKLYEELQKLLEEQQNVENIQEMLNKMQNKEENLEKELERALELFKKMKFDNKLEETIKELDELEKEQEKLNQKTEDSSKKENSNEELAKEQEELKEKFEDVKKDVEEMEELNQDLEQPQSIPEDIKKQQDSIEKDMEDATQKLQENKRNKAGESQKKAEEKMEKMEEKLSQMQSSMEMNMMMENLDDLRHIIHNLLKLSFDQEKLMKDFEHVDQSDPRFVSLAQQQLKIMDDSRIIEDSLQALASRVFQIQSFVTRELSEMNNYLEQATEAIRERRKSIAVSRQQFAMTSMNNLALLLDDVLQQMQNAMAEAMGNQTSKGKKQQGMSLGELQKQLNQQIEDLKKSGKSGRELSEELAKLAAEQERIRQALQEMQEKFGNQENGGMKPGEGIPEKMEETEMDLVKKQITEETIQRQKEILVRLLEAEKSMREKELDDERKGETAKPVEREVPASFEEYFKQKQQEIELLKTIPPKLFPYYRKEVNDYFKRLGEQAQ